MNTDFTVTGIERVILVGENEYTGRETRFSGFTSCNELIFQFSGDYSVEFGNRTNRITPNSIRFLPQGEHNVYHVFDREKSGECIDIFFTADRAVSDEMIVLSMENNKRIGELFRRVFATWVAKREGYRFTCMSLLYEIFAEIEKEYGYAQRSAYEKIRPAVQYIEEHFLEKDLRCDALPSLCGISYTYLKQLFLSCFHVTPKQYATQMKMRYAGELLRSGRFSVSAAAEQCGFYDVCFFSRQFKRAVGCTPSDFLKKYRSSK